MKKIMLESIFSLGVLVFFTFFTCSSPVKAELNYRGIYTSSSGSKNLLLLIDSYIQSPLYGSNEFQLWKSDLEQENYKLQITEVTTGTAAELRDYMKAYSDTYGLEGVIMIGDLPYATYEMNLFFYETFPIDLFFTDLDGVWQDTDKNEFYDTHTGNRYPEIWLGRIKTSNLSSDTRDELTTLRYYFNKSHAYKHGLLPLNKRALAYIDDDWSRVYSSVNLDSVYSSVTVINDNTITSAPDYKNKLKENYEWVHLWVHSAPTLHHFKSNGGDAGTVFSTDLVAVDPYASFYNLDACSNVDYSYHDYMGGFYVFNRSYGLAAVGSTKAGGMLGYESFYPHLGPNSKKSIGEALVKWFTAQDFNSPIGGPQYAAAFYGLTIIGDPTLNLFPPFVSSATPSPAPVCTPRSAPDPCPGSTLCEASKCWNSTSLNSNWWNCNQYDYDGNCNISIIDIQKCAYKCKLDGTLGACCNSSHQCNSGLQCSVCYQSFWGECILPRPSPTPKSGCPSLTCDINDDGKEDINDGNFIKNCWNHPYPLDECKKVDVVCDDKITTQDIQQFSHLCPQIFIIPSPVLMPNSDQTNKKSPFPLPKTPIPVK